MLIFTVSTLWACCKAGVFLKLLYVFGLKVTSGTQYWLAPHPNEAQRHQNRKRTKSYFSFEQVTNGGPHVPYLLLSCLTRGLGRLAGISVPDCKKYAGMFVPYVTSLAFDGLYRISLPFPTPFFSSNLWFYLYLI